jgi:phosphate transport system substrate-binding protein
MAKALLLVVSLLLGTSCSSSSGKHAKAHAAAPISAGTIAIDGSSTVLPVSEAFAEEFRKTHPATRVIVSGGGTGAGFRKLCHKAANIIGASRPISAAEAETCRTAGVEYIELPIAYDGMAVVVHPGNTWVDQITVQELKKLWEPAAEGKVTTWSQIRHGWPDEPIHLFGPGLDSGTYDYFTKAIVGEERHGRTDYVASEDDQVIVTAVARDRLALGFFGMAYFEKNKDKLKEVPIDDGIAANGAGPIRPTRETILDGTYQPLSRPLFVYVNRVEAERLEVNDFIRASLRNAGRLVDEVGYISFPAKYYQKAQARFDARKLGSAFAGRGAVIGARVTEALFD